jgi:hypothetical protein
MTVGYNLTSDMEKREVANRLIWEYMYEVMASLRMECIECSLPKVCTYESMEEFVPIFP